MAGAPGYAPTPDHFHPLAVVAVDASESDEAASNAVASGWVPGDPSALELVACIQPEEEANDQNCTYVNGPPATMHMYKRKVQLIDARTGQVVQEQEFYGTGTCPETLQVDVTEVPGSHVGWDDPYVWDWIWLGRMGLWSTATPS